jgi:TolB-like protein/Tfp pilus assembly protein PilF
MLYEMLTGERPFDGTTPQAVMAKRFTETARPLRALRATIPEAIERAIAKAMTIEVSGRFTTTGQFGQALASGSMHTPSATMAMQPVVSAAKSVAVLPFANMSNDPENEYFTDGMAEEIINALAKIQALRVASRTSSFAFKGKNEDIGEIGKKLKVSTVLEGSVRKMGNKLRITAQLVNVADGYQLWSERYDREIEDVFAIQDDISQAIVKALRVILSEGEKKQIEKARAVNLEAYDFYLRGRQSFHQLRRKSLDHARQMFDKAIALDPDYALAYAAIALCYAELYGRFDAREFNLRQADAASSKALALEPDLAEAHLARGMVVSLSKRFAEAREEFERAIALDPSFDALFWYGRNELSHGLYERAIGLFERAAKVRPDDYLPGKFIAQALKSLGRDEECLGVSRRHIVLVERFLELHPEDSRALMTAAALYASVGDPDLAMDYAKRAMAVDPDDPRMLYNAACMLACSNKITDALDALERAVANGWGDKSWLEHDSDLDPIRNEPRYLALVKAM